MNVYKASSCTMFTLDDANNGSFMDFVVVFCQRVFMQHSATTGQTKRWINKQLSTSIVYVHIQRSLTHHSRLLV